MALNFPNSPTLNQVYTDSTSGFSYQWNGTVWISFSAASSSQIKTLDDISSGFNNSTQTFALTSGALSISPPTSQSLIINLGGVIQDATDDYSVSGSNIVFSTAPTNGLSFSGVSLGPAVPVDYANNGNVYTRNIYTATASQTVFTITGTYTVGYIEVYRNGVRLTEGTDFTATNGTTFVLTTPANLNDEVVSVAYKVASLVTTTGQFDNLIISGVSTFVGFATHTGTIFGNNLSLTGIVTATEFDISGSSNTLTAGGLNVGIATASSVIVGSAVTINSSGINVTGITTIKNASGTVTIGIGTTALLVEGNARVTGILTVGSASITLDGATNVINVGTGLTLSSSGINITGIITATSFVGSGSGLTGVGIGSTGSINTSGIITATSFVGSGSGLTGVGIGSTGNINTTGIITATSFVGSGSGLTGVGIGSTGSINTSGIITATSFVGSGSGLTGVGIGSTGSINTSGIITASSFVGALTGNATGLSGSPNITVGVLTATSINVPPVPITFSPSIGATNVALASNIIITFNVGVTTGTGNITLRSNSAGGTAFSTIGVSSSSVTISGGAVTIDPPSNIGTGVTTFVVVDAGAFSGLTTTSVNNIINTYSFTTVPLSPSSIVPANAATNVAISTNITLTFNAPPPRGTGTITLRSGSTSGTVIETFDAASSNRITVVGNVYTIDPTSDLAEDTSIHTIIPSTAITGYVGLNTTGADTHSFTTAAPAVGSSFGGGFLICKSSPVRWVVSPYSAQVGRSWYLREDANTTAQSVSGCTGWFVPTISQLQNPGYLCRSFWGPSPCYSSPAYYWSSTQRDAPFACLVYFSDGNATFFNKTLPHCVRAFRCVTY